MTAPPWATTTLSDTEFFELIGGLWKGKRPPYATATVIRNTNFSRFGRLDLSDVAVLDVEARQLTDRQLHPGDVIIERSGGGPKQPVGRASYFDVKDGGPYSFSNFTSTVRVRDRRAFSPRFVAYYLLYLYEAGVTAPLQRATTGLRNLDWGAYTELEIPRPPLDEQTRIVTVLGLAQKALEVEERACATIRELKQAAMARLFSVGLTNGMTVETPYGLIPDTWAIRPLGECAATQSGVTKGRQIPPAEAIEVPYLRVANVQDGRLDLRSVKKIVIRRDELQKYALRDGDVVLTEGGDLDKLGRGFIWRSEIADCVHQNHVFAVRPNPRVLLPEYLAYLVQTSYGRSYFLSVAHRTTNLASINLTKLKAFPVPLPGVEEQRHITSMLSTIDEVLAVTERQLSTMQEMFLRLLGALMSGDVRVDSIDLKVSDLVAA